MDGFENSRASSPFDDPTRMGGVAGEPLPERPANDLDSGANRALFSKLRDWYDQEWERQAHNRYQMALDEDYYDSMQWSEEDAQALLERGQAPLVFNEIKPTIDWILGTERRTRIDYKVQPRKKDGGQDAENKTKLLKYLSDTNKTVFSRSRAFGDAVKAGLGILEVGLRGDQTEELLYTRYENWRYTLYDSNSVEPDWEDARYFFRWKWLDQDIAEAYFPERTDIIKKGATDKSSLEMNEDDDEIWYLGARVSEPGEDYSRSVGKYRPYDGSAFANSRRSRIKMIECWYKEPVLVRKFSYGPMAGMAFEKGNVEHVAALRSGYSLYDKLEMRVMCAVFCNGGLVFKSESPYEHGRFPFVPVWCYRRKRDNAPYGAIRNLRDPQDDLNKRASKSLWILSTNRVIMERGAVDDIDELREEVARPDAVVVKNPGKQLEINSDSELAQAHLGLMERDIQHIRNVGGVTNENLGRQTNATSGVAIANRQEQGGVVTTEMFDNLRYAVQLLGELELANIEQFYTQEKVIRLVGPRGTASFVELNKVDPVTGEVLNDITAMKGDFIVDEQDYRSSLRQAMFESLFDLMGRLGQVNPQVALNLLDLVVEMADVPNRDELVSRIRQINGQKDPEAEQTPEELQQQQAQAEQQALQQQVAMETLQAQLAEMIAKGEHMNAQAIQKRVEAMYSALQAAQVIAVAPGIAPVADEIMKGSGFVDMAPALDQQTALAAQAAGPIPPAENPSPLLGVQQGIQTMAPDGVR
jgi:hypothetical protein